jgi:S1-C subfamily serine protease
MYSRTLKIVGLAALTVALAGIVTQAGQAATERVGVFVGDDEKPKDKDASKADRPQGFIGIQLEMNEDGGPAVLAGTLPDSPADKAGFKQGDVVLKVGDVETKDVQSVIKAVRKLKPGDKVTIKVKRDDKEKDLKVTVGKRPAEENPPQDKDK